MLCELFDSKSSIIYNLLMDIGKTIQLYRSVDWKKLTILEGF